MPEYQEFYDQDGNTQRAYKAEDTHEVDTIAGRQTVSTGDYVVERDKPQYVDVVSADAFEEGYQANKPAKSDDKSDVDGDNKSKVDAKGLPFLDGDADDKDSRPVTAPRSTRK